MITLGINAAYHDSAACLVRDGVLIAAAEEERFTRIKHAKRPIPFTAFEQPHHAVEFCLRQAGIGLRDVDHIGYSYDPALFTAGRAADLACPLSNDALVRSGWDSPWDPLFATYLREAPAQLADGYPHHLRERLAGTRPGQPWRWHFVPHHLAHQASAFLAAPFDRCAVLTLDGRGENSSTVYGVYRDGHYRQLGQVELPNSLGLLYEDITRHLGFLHSSDEYKVMALASYGRPALLDEFRAAVRWVGAGQYRTERVALMARLGDPRERGRALTEHHFDIACSLQQVLEETAIEIAAWLAQASGERNLAMAGGVALNCVMNARIRDSGHFDQVWVQPAAGDAGTALGAALWIDRLQHGEGSARRWHMTHAYYGPGFDNTEIERFLLWSKLRYRLAGDMPAEAARLLAADKILGWFQGPMEFGPRALGARSILASPVSPTMQARLNEIKDREDFRPVAPSVLRTRAAEWFADCDDSPFMLFVHDVLPERSREVPAICHVDGTARVQTVDAASNPLYHALLVEFERLTGVPILVNTSFNTRGEPIVCSPRDAIECFWSSPLDALAIGPFLLEKEAA